LGIEKWELVIETHSNYARSVWQSSSFVLQLPITIFQFSILFLLSPALRRLIRHSLRRSPHVRIIRRHQIVLSKGRNRELSRGIGIQMPWPVLTG